MATSQVNYHFGNILRKQRETRRMLQEEFAEKCGISRAYYGRLERGEHSITLDLCDRISGFLGIELFELFTDIP